MIEQVLHPRNLERALRQVMVNKGSAGVDGLKDRDLDEVRKLTRYYTFGPQGNGGQKIYLLKEQNMVIVITGGNYNSQSPSDELIKKCILPAFNKK